MLVEVGVQDLGVIARARIPFSEGLVALTGETGAGKTMVVEALELLSGGRADPARVRPGSEAAVVEGLFVVGDTEWVLRRVVPAVGRSRSYVNGELVTAAAQAELAASLIEVHGQHGQQSLLRPSSQRDALDRFAGIDRSGLVSARSVVRDLRAKLADLGGDDRARSRELDLLRYQADEIAAVDPIDGEDERLSEEEDLLADAVGHRDAAASATALLTADGGDGVGAVDAVAAAVHEVDGRHPFGTVAARLHAVVAELSDCAAELRRSGESIEPDEERLTVIRERRHALVELRRKYGDTIAEVLSYAEEVSARIVALTSVDEARATVTAELDAALADLDRQARLIGRKRRAAAPELADRVGRLLADLALPGARVEVAVADTDDQPGAGESVELRLSTNAGIEPGPLSRVASGGELSRVMLALRLVLTGGPPTMVFDEVDAGVGGEAATAVGEALARLGESSQVLVVTHLAQVAAGADHQLLVAKSESSDQTTTTTVEPLDGESRVVEVSRMLSGSPGSDTARRHAEELLAGAGRGKDA